MTGAVSQSDDEPWLARLRAGDHGAFEEVVREFHAPLFTYMLRATHARDVAEDLVQDLFARLWDNRATLRPHASLRVYLYVAARHHLYDHYRKRQTAATLFQPASSTDTAMPLHADDPLAELANAELVRAVRRAVEALPPRCREVWELSRNHGLGYEEISRVTGVSINTVKTQMARALRALREALVPFLAATVVLGIA
jgi:RNA polymerase sigma-70 factor (ECF subfamily)